MKNVLSLLVAFVFVQTQCWALSGGPVYPGNSNTVTGQYAGILLPDKLGSNALGLFTLNVPATGLANGVFEIFASGVLFSGTAKGLIDPDSLKLSAIVDGNEVITANVLTTPAVPADPTANPPTAAVPAVYTEQQVNVAIVSGTIKARVNTDSAVGSSQDLRLVGTGHLDLMPIDITGLGIDLGSNTPVSGTLNFAVDGWKQTPAVAGAAGGVGGVATPAPVTPVPAS